MCTSVRLSYCVKNVIDLTVTDLAKIENRRVGAHCWHSIGSIKHTYTHKIVCFDGCRNKQIQIMYSGLLCIQGLNIIEFQYPNNIYKHLPHGYNSTKNQFEVTLGWGLQ